jgi:hypothetical protein
VQQPLRVQRLPQRCNDSVLAPRRSLHAPQLHLPLRHHALKQQLRLLLLHLLQLQQQHAVLQRQQLAPVLCRSVPVQLLPQRPALRLILLQAAHQVAFDALVDPNAMLQLRDLLAGRDHRRRVLSGRRAAGRGLAAASQRRGAVRLAALALLAARSQASGRRRCGGDAEASEYELALADLH